jgi:RNA polymerase sigma-70 factor (ECF subfamily)
MTESTVSQIQRWIEAMNAGDPSARDALIEHAYQRLRGLTRKLLRDFHRLERWEEADDVLQAALVRLLRALQVVEIASVAEFFRLATVQIRRELLDLTRHYFGPEGMGANQSTAPPGQAGQGTAAPACDWPETTSEPGKLAAWTEMHQQVEQLPAEVRDVFELLWYQGLTQAETAAILGVAEITVKRRWAEARLLLAGFLEEGM